VLVVRGAYLLFMCHGRFYGSSRGRFECCRIWGACGYLCVITLCSWLCLALYLFRCQAAWGTARLQTSRQEHVRHKTDCARTQKFRFTPLANF